jgi:hypothetical protein
MIFIDIPQIVPMKMGLLAAPGLPKAEAQRSALQRRHQLLSGQRVHVDAIGRQQDATNCDLGLQRDSQFQRELGRKLPSSSRTNIQKPSFNWPRFRMVDGVDLVEMPKIEMCPVNPGCFSAEVQ